MAYRIIQKLWKHILVGAVLLIYLLAVPTLYFKWFVTDGKALSGARQLPARASGFRANVELVAPADQSGGYVVSGWGFLTADEALDAKEYEKEIVLISSSNIYFFKAWQEPRKDVDVFFNLPGKNLEMAGFHSQISIYALRLATYRIGILFRPKSGVAVYGETNQCVRRTPNHLLLIDCP